MSYHRRSTTVTIPDATGYEEDDVSIFPVSSRGRLTALVAVAVTDVVGSPQLTVREVDVGEDEDGEEDLDIEYPGDQLIYIAQPEERTYYVLSSEAVDQDGVAIAGLYQPPLISTRQVRVELAGASGDAVTVDLVYETAGDQRF